MRRQELQELRKLQIEEQRKMAALQHKLGTQTEQLTMKCEREIYVSFFLFRNGSKNRHYFNFFLNYTPSLKMNGQM